MLNKLKKSNRYQYTCPDVIHYRKNQYRLAIYSNVFAVATQVLFWGGLVAMSKRLDPKPTLKPVEPLSPSDAS